MVAPVRATPAVTVDRYGQNGELWQYPYPLSETEFLVSYSPWGRERDPLLFGVYFMTIDGRRELLVSDPLVSCNQPVPLRRPVPHCRPDTTDYTQQTGTFYIQDVYAGPGLTGIPRGKAKKLRVIGLDFRATVIGGNHNRGEAGEAFVATPVAVAQGSWEAKTVLGETPVCADGSAYFTAPARTPLYFQVIDEKGQAIQTMRSWTTLQPGENASCVGCHEHKSESPLAIPAREAFERGPRPLEPFYGPPRGFSFAQEIQPILDRHCTSCHHDRSSLPWLAGATNPEHGRGGGGRQRSRLQSAGNRDDGSGRQTPLQRRLPGPDGSGVGIRPIPGRHFPTAGQLDLPPVRPANAPALFCRLRHQRPDDSSGAGPQGRQPQP